MVIDGNLSYYDVQRCVQEFNDKVGETHVKAKTPETLRNIERPPSREGEEADNARS